MPRSGRALFSTLFLLSGLAGLIYEVCWTRLLRLPMGNTVYSLTTVLTAFMGGLALGSWLAGRWIDRRGHPLRVYAFLEAAIGTFCLALPWIVSAETPLFRWAYQHLSGSFYLFHLLKLVACGLVILVPATLMGATLPVLCRYFITDVEHVGNSVGWLYAVNALGAVAGSLLAGFVLIPRLGQQDAIRIGVATSWSVAAIAWASSRRYAARGWSAARTTAPAAKAAAPPAPAAAPVSAGELAPRARRLVLLGYGLSGLAAMVFQIAWARVLALVLGSSVYAFALLVAAFILGLALGSGATSRFADRLRRPALGFALAELGIGITALLMVPIFQRFPDWMLRIVPEVSRDFGRFQLVQFALLFGALLLPTACMGACLPLVGRALVRGVEHAGETVGTAYSANAVGTILGAFLGGFVILPGLGIQRSILVGAALNLAVGVALLALVLPRRSARPLALATALAGCGALVLVPGFDPLTMASGAYLYAGSMREALRPGTSLRQLLADEYRILMHREGLSSTITVRQSADGDRTLAINGKVDASDQKDMATQLLSGHLACLLHPQPQDAAVIGLATGVTLHSVAQHPGIRSIDCIEIDPEMAQACRLFDHVNGRILDDPRLHLVIQDGRNHLALTGRSYDIILSEPSNPWIAGIASLYTREFLQACRDRLRPHGVMVVWMHVYGFDLHAIRSMTRTFAEVFPHATLWETYFLADYVLVGTKDELLVGWDDLAGRMHDAKVAADLARVGVVTPADLLVRQVADAAGVQRLAAGGEVYSDDRNRLEFDAPRLMYHPLDLQELAILEEVRQSGMPAWLRPPASGFPAQDLAELDAAQRAQREFWEGMLAREAGDSPGATRLFLGAMELHPRIASAPEPMLGTLRDVADAAVARGDTLAAEQLYQRVLALDAGLPDYWDDLGVLLAQQGRLPQALEAYRKAVDLKPDNLQMRSNLALALGVLGQPRAAELELQRVLSLRPDRLQARLDLGNLFVQQGDLAGAERQYRTAVANSPQSAEAWFLLGETLRARAAWRDAVDAYKRALDRDPKHAMARQRLAECDRQLG